MTGTGMLMSEALLDNGAIPYSQNPNTHIWMNGCFLTSREKATCFQSGSRIFPMRRKPLSKGRMQMSAVAKFKRDLAKHRGRAALLGILFVAMVAMGVRAVTQLQPRAAVAKVTPAQTPGAASSSETPVATVNPEARLRESKELWKRLKEVKATAAAPQAAFTFEPGYYPPPTVTDITPPVFVSEIAPTPKPVVDEAGIRAARIREQARALVVKSTAVGNGNMEPMAIVNQQLVTVGHKILGFEISAIRAREVEFVKDGVNTVVRMPDGQ
jgi:hypothetical protein